MMPLLFTSLLASGAGEPAPPTSFFIDDLSHTPTFDAPAHRFVQTTLGRRALCWDDVPLATDVEVLARVKLSNAAEERIGIVLRVSGGAGSEIGLVWQVNNVTAGEANLFSYNAGSGSSLWDNGRTARSSVWYWLRLRVSANNLKGRLWQEPDPEPVAWAHERTLTAVLGSGRVGLFSFNSEGDGKYCDYFSAGIEGVAAPDPGDALVADQYRADFAASGIDGDWTQRWGTAGTTTSIVTEADDILPLGYRNIQQQGRSDSFRLQDATDLNPKRIRGQSPGSGENFINTGVGMTDFPASLNGDLLVRLRSGLGGDSNAGAMMRADPDTGVAVTAQLTATTGAGSNQFTLRRLNTDGSFVALVTVGFSWSIGTWYFIRMNLAGTTLRARIWAVDTAEPAGWTIEVTDPALPDTPGLCGWLTRRRNTNYTQIAYIAFSPDPAIPARLPQ